MNNYNDEQSPTLNNSASSGSSYLFHKMKDSLESIKKTHVNSWMISGWLGSVSLGSDGGGTTCLTIGCPDDFYAVRLGFANTTPTPWKMTRAIGRASSNFGDYVNPTGQAPWTTFTFAGGGADNEMLTTTVDAPTEIIVHGNCPDPLTGEAENPSWTWTDWTPIRSVAPDPATGMRVLMLRGLVPSSQTICFANAPLQSITGNFTLNRGFDIFIGGIKFNFDGVNENVQNNTEKSQVWKDNILATGSLFPIVQFLTRKPGIVGMTTGDSHHQGTATTDQFTGYLYRAITTLGCRNIGNIPFGMANLAKGGLTSDQFFPRMEALLHAIRPSFVVLPGWSYNDRTSDVHADQPAVDRFLARLIQAAELCERQGILPIFLTPLPRDAQSMSEIQLAPWNSLRKTILELQLSGKIVLDVGDMVGNKINGFLDGTYASTLSDDGAHPNDLGHSWIAADLITLLQNICL